MTQPRISTPAGFAPAFAVGYADPSSRLARVSAATPLPVTLATPAAAGPLEGEALTALLAGPFHPAGPAPVTVTLSGNWQGEVRLRRSTDGGTTLHDLAVAGLDWGVFDRNGAQQVWSETEAGASLWLDIEITGGTCTYRVAQ